MTRWYLDACSLINLYASRHLEAIAARQTGPFLVVPTVVAEAGWIYQRSGLERGCRVPIPMTALADAGVIEVISPTAAMMAQFMRLVLDLDDGEAMTIAAAAETRDSGVVTDDDAALNYLAQWPAVATSTSLSLLRDIFTDLPDNERGEMLLDLRICARYIPGARHPELTWWKALVREQLRGTVVAELERTAD